MANIDSWVENARQEGYSTLYASAKVCQDIVLKLEQIETFLRGIEDP